MIPRRWWPLTVITTILVLDRLTKWWIEARVDFWEVIPVIPGLFQIVHTRNRGIAFGIFNDPDSKVSTVVLIVFTLAVISFLLVMLWRYVMGQSKEHWTYILALALVTGGALGNLYDRVVFGSVTDFLDFYWGKAHFPVFNVADSAITVGAGLLILNLWKPSTVRE